MRFEWKGSSSTRLTTTRIIIYYLDLCYVIDYVAKLSRQARESNGKFEVQNPENKWKNNTSIYMQDWQLAPNASTIVSIIIYSINSKFQLNKEFKYWFRFAP